jgi:hypothetical protein
VTDLYEPYDKLIPIEVLGKRLEVPENNILLRQLQYVAPDVGAGGYCWNAECRYCEIKYEVDGRTMTGLACRVKAVPNFKVTKLAPELKYNISEALRNATPVDPAKT